MVEGEARVAEDGRDDPLAAEDCLGELAEYGAHGEGGRGHDARPVHSLAEDVGELLLPDRGRAGEVDRTRYLGVVDEEGQGADLVLQGDPGPPLATAAHRPAEAEPGQREDASHGAALLAQHEAAARVSDPDAGVRGGPGGGLPGPDDVGEEPRPEAALLGELLLTAVGAVDVHARRRDQDGTAGAGTGTANRLGERRRQVRRPSTREAKISCLYDGVHRWSPTPAPARWTTASTPTRRCGSSSRSVGSQLISAAVRAGRRDRCSTSSPRALRCSDSALPIRPEAPVIATRIVMVLRSEGT